MSLFKTVDAVCPSCKTLLSFEMVHSVNADRRPALRAEILARTFQRQTCTACGDQFRMEPEFTYVEQGAKLWMAVWPVDKLGDWATFEARSLKAFDASFGSAAGPAAAALGAELRVRVVFGWEAACEKLVAFQADIDDVDLELAKVALFRQIDGLGLGDDVELRLLGVDEQQTMFIGRFQTGTEELLETLEVPRELLAEIAADAEAWQPLREQLDAGPFKDTARLMIEPAAAALEGHRAS